MPGMPQSEGHLLLVWTDTECQHWPDLDFDLDLGFACMHYRAMSQPVM